MNKRTLFFMAMLWLSAAVSMIYAVPARRGWQTRTQADGTTIQIQQLGDEFYHYMINRDGQEVREVNGFYQVVGEAPTPEMARARRAKGVARRQRKEVGTTPYLAPRGLLILVNFKDTKMQTKHTHDVFDELCNSKNCTVNSFDGVNFGSAAQFFSDQSNGSYQPVFDVYGPVTLSNNCSYYGGNDSNGDDEYATDAVIEACILANQQYPDLDFSKYNADGDSYVDFVYVIYAGKGEADGGSENTIWPHNWEIQKIAGTSYSNYTKAQTKLDGLYLNNYACSGELVGWESTPMLNGIGTFCHEFGHVIGLPDFYDTKYSTNYRQALTPNDWDLMDGGGYNGDGHCPPNYSPWEKYFFGWATPTNLGNQGQVLSLVANGQTGYNPYQINSSGTQQTATTSGLCYYIENRQQTGWDTYVPYHGMLIWKVNFSASAWSDNIPNNTANNPRYTIVSASGTKIGTHYNNPDDPDYYVYDGVHNPFPGQDKVTSYTDISGKPLLDIKESNQIVTLTYIEEPAVVVDPFDITWKANGTEFATTTSTGQVVLPTTEPAACDGKVFIGWCAEANYSSETTAPTLVNAGDAVEEGAVFYAVFATQDGEGGETTWNLVTDDNSLNAGDVLVIACSSKGATAGNIDSQIMGSVTSTFSSDKTQITTLDNGTVELTLGGSKGAWTLSSTSGLLGATAVKKLAWASGTTTWSITISGDNATIQNGTEGYGRFLYNANSPRFTTYTSDANASMLLPQLYRKSNGVSYKDYTTTCSSTTDLEGLTTDQPTAVKILRDGQIYILRTGAVYTLTGERVE